MPRDSVSALVIILTWVKNILFSNPDISCLLYLWINTYIVVAHYKKAEKMN